MLTRHQVFRNGFHAFSLESHRHGIKYRLYYGLKDGRCIVRYDNEAGKGDHRHYENREEPYRFIDVETLVRDFLADVVAARRADQ
ncbi:MAG: DUF6516 family protein [Acidobacteriota bacterium]